MSWYGVGILRDVRMGPPIREYLERIDVTLAPFGGRFIVHGGGMEMLEGENPGTLIVIEFPDRERARQWYSSPAYQKILPLRTENSLSTVFLAEGVDRTHRATDVPAGVGVKPRSRPAWPFAVLQAPVLTATMGH